MPISGLVVKVDSAQRNDIISTLNKLNNVELAETPEGGALVVVIDVATMGEEEALFKIINEIPGVSNVTLSYHNFEDISAEHVN